MVSESGGRLAHKLQLVCKKNESVIKTTEPKILIRMRSDRIRATIVLIALPEMLASSPRQLIGVPSALIAPPRDLIRATVTLITPPTRLTSSLRQVINTQER